MSRECCHDLAQNVDAINIDIKGYTEEFYKNVCGARLQPVLDNVRLLYELGVWVEVTTLIIPGKNDVPDDLARLAAFIVSVDTDIPWHVSAFHPAYQLNALESTPDGTLHVARKIGQDAGLRYVYTGNIRDSAGENTCCPRCNSELVRRRGFTVVTNRLCNGQCPDCGEVIAGIWHTPHAV
jgi:pyruvate formate lyase activating enzyme